MKLFHNLSFHNFFFFFTSFHSFWIVGLFIYFFRRSDFQSVVVVSFLKIKFLGLSDLFISIYRIGYWNILEFLICIRM